MSHSGSLVRLASCSLLLLAAACGGSAGSVGDEPPGSSGGSGTGTGTGTGAGTGTGTSGASGAVVDGPSVTLSLRGSTAPVAHADSLAGQTPISQIVAVRSLWLLRSPSDPAPLRVADLGAGSVETDLVTGVTNDVATVSLKSLPAGTFTIAKVGVAYVRYSVAARMHSGGFPVDGRYDNVQALSDGATVDGAPRKKGWYRYAFAVGPTTYGALEGADAPLPALSASGGMTLETAGPESYYVFPANVTIDPAHPSDLRLVCEVNVHESFRWMDQTAPGFTPNVFDATPSTYEPVITFGASAFRLVLEAK